MPVTKESMFAEDKETSGFGGSPADSDIVSYDPMGGGGLFSLASELCTIGAASEDS